MKDYLHKMDAPARSSVEHGTGHEDFFQYPVDHFLPPVGPLKVNVLMRHQLNWNLRVTDPPRSAPLSRESISLPTIDPVLVQWQIQERLNAGDNFDSDSDENSSSVNTPVFVACAAIPFVAVCACLCFIFMVKRRKPFLAQRRQAQLQGDSDHIVVFSTCPCDSQQIGTARTVPLPDLPTYSAACGPNFPSNPPPAVEPPSYDSATHISGVANMNTERAQLKSYVALPPPPPYSGSG